MRNNQKGIIQFILILAVAVVGLFLVGYNLYKNGKILIYFTSQNTSSKLNGTSPDISDWKTYRNERYGFEFKYPSDLNLRTSSESMITLEREFISDSENYDKNFWLRVYVSENPNRYTPETFFTKQFCDTIEKTPYTENVAESRENCKNSLEENKQLLEVAGLESLRTIHRNYVMESSLTMIDNKNYFIIFDLSGGEEPGTPSQTAINTLDQILSTFEFTN